MFKGQTIRKLMGGRAGEVEKKYSHKGKLNLKKFMHEKYSCYSEKKIHTRNLITKKNSCSSKIPPPNNSNGPSLIAHKYSRCFTESNKAYNNISNSDHSDEEVGGHDFSKWSGEGGVIERGRGKSF